MTFADAAPNFLLSLQHAQSLYRQHALKGSSAHTYLLLITHRACGILHILLETPPEPCRLTRLIAWLDTKYNYPFECPEKGAKCNGNCSGQHHHHHHHGSLANYVYIIPHSVTPFYIYNNQIPLHRLIFVLSFSLSLSCANESCGGCVW